ncbi:hypothetical protein B0O41_2470 [Propionibacteriaceae bacterium ES.041]|uniref:Rv3235 family protein n=1 Tax=Enemella evansiae TaxID=2016499 RepID=UPI000B96566E|nr:Rv3235 family protein [Enemella evansiae]OYN94589.1 hypothetical protein CGZ96_17055 [Enemella evansiae]PFG67650.1 hypothetical protein B0O41_2470 [Propionibacteriaceae bacterium ES.041]
MTVIEAAAPLVRPLPDHRPVARDRSRRPEPATPVPLPLAADPVPTVHTPARDPALDPRLRGQLQGLATAIVDAVAGRRPLQQLIRWVDERVLAELALRSRLFRLRGRSVGVRSVRLQRTEDRVEATLRIGDDEHGEALALRFDLLGTRWVCTVADFGPTPGPGGITAG